MLLDRSTDFWESPIIHVWLLFLILDFEILVEESNSKISRQNRFNFVKILTYRQFTLSDRSTTFFSNCNLESFFFENNVVKVFHASFDVFLSLIYSNNFSLIVVFITNIALPALILHFFKDPTSSDCITSFP